MSIVQEPILVEKPARASVRVSRRFQLTWPQIGLGAVLLLSAGLNLWLLNPAAFTNEYYAAAVRSMMLNWHNFFYNAFDPGGFITVDKPPVALWLQTISAWLLGYNGVTILLPSALAGVGSVALIYTMVKRGFGPVAGLTAAFVMAITPIFVVMNRHNNPESLLIFFMLLGAWAISRATTNGRLTWLILAMALIGVAFNVKMLEAFIILPTFYLLYFLLSPIKWWQRILHLTAATLVLAVVSLSWAVAVDLTPTSQRPFIGSSSNNTVMNLIFNYNGLNRVEGQTFGGNGAGGFPNGGRQPANSNQGNGPTQGGGRQFGGGGGQPGGGFGGPGGGVIAGQAGPLRLFDPSLAGEAGWLLPFALLSIGAVGLQTRRRFGPGQARRQRYGALVLWGGWLLTFMVVFSMAAGTFHSYYLVLLTPGIAALSGMGVESLWHAYRHSKWLGWGLPLALFVTGVFQFNILSRYTDWNRAMGLLIVGLELIVAVALVAGPRLVRRAANRGWAMGLTVVGFGGLCIAPLAWSVSAVLNKPYTNETLPTAVPVGASTVGSGRSATNPLLNNLTTHWNSWLTGLVVALLVLVGLTLAGRFLATRLKSGSGLSGLTTLASVIVVIALGLSLALTSLPTVAASTSPATPTSTGMIGNPQMMLSNPDKLSSFLEANRNGRTYLLATTSSQNASPLIIETGQAVMALGGFQGMDQTVTAQQFAALVNSNVIRYVLLDSGGFGRFGGGNGSQSATGWVQQNCQVVNASLWSSGTTSPGTTNNNRFGSSSSSLYDCASQG